MSSDDLARLFEAERAVHPPSGRLERTLERLLSEMAHGAAPLPVATGSLKLGLSLASKWVAVGFVVGVGGAGAASQVWAPTAVAAPSGPTRAAVVVAAPPNTELVPHPSLPTAPEAPVAGMSVQAPAQRALPGAPAADTSTSAGKLAEEMRLIAAAKRDLEAGRPQLATAWLSEHGSRFPAGVFATEREGLSVLIRCGGEKNPLLAERFSAAHPSSPLVARLRRACSPGSSPSTSTFPNSDK